MKYPKVILLRKDEYKNEVDDFVKENDISSIDLLKIDTQGFDLEVLNGAKASLESGMIKNVLVEINFISMYEKQGSAGDVIRELESVGFVLVDFYEKVRQDKVLAWCTALFANRK